MTLLHTHHTTSQPCLLEELELPLDVELVKCRVSNLCVNLHLLPPLQEKFVLVDYMPKQPSIGSSMRAILVDWLVEVQVGHTLPVCYWYTCERQVSWCERVSPYFCGE